MAQESRAAKAWWPADQHAARVLGFRVKGLGFRVQALKFRGLAPSIPLYDSKVFPHIIPYMTRLRSSDYGSLPHVLDKERVV